MLHINTIRADLALTRDVPSRQAGHARPASRAVALALAGITMSATLLGAPRTAHAEEVSPDGKGIVGGALLGAEVVVFAEAIFGVRSSTAYLLGAGGGAVAGGVGGYFIERGVDNGRVPAYLLAGGLALIIPALVVTLDQTRYLPPEGARPDKPVNNFPPSDPGQPGGAAVIGAEPSTTPPPATPNTAPPANPPSGTTPAPPAPGGGAGGGTPQGPSSLLNLHRGGLRIGLPVPEVRPVFSSAQRKALAVESTGSELRFPVVTGTF